MRALQSPRQYRDGSPSAAADLLFVLNERRNAGGGRDDPAHDAKELQSQRLAGSYIRPIIVVSLEAPGTTTL